jgi:hypothetical protein
MDALTMTDDQVRLLMGELLKIKRQNAYTRAIRKDCQGALDGSAACRASAAEAWNRLFLPPTTEGK